MAPMLLHNDEGKVIGMFTFLPCDDSPDLQEFVFVPDPDATEKEVGSAVLAWEKAGLCSGKKVKKISEERQRIIWEALKKCFGEGDG